MQGSRSNLCCDRAMPPPRSLHRAGRGSSLASCSPTPANASCTASSWAPPWTTSPTGDWSSPAGAVAPAGPESVAAAGARPAPFSCHSFQPASPSPRCCTGCTAQDAAAAPTACCWTTRLRTGGGASFGCGVVGHTLKRVWAAHNNPCRNQTLPAVPTLGAGAMVRVGPLALLSVRASDPTV